MSSLILMTHEGPVTTITLNRPEKRNALSVPLLEELCTAIHDAEIDASRRILVLRGEGSVFCAGLDLLEVIETDNASASAEYLGRALQSLAMTRLITIAAVQGAAIAGGAGLMSACDFAI